MPMRNDDARRSKDRPLHEAVVGEVPHDTPELERYELFEGPRYRFELDRRGFVKTFGAGLLVLLVASKRGHAQESGRGFGGGDRMPSDVGAWLHIAENGAITVFTGKTEIGQNIRTSLTQAVAEELGAPIGSISLVMADTGRTPFDMGTFGSRTTPTMNAQLRKVAAAARAVLANRANARGTALTPAIFGELVKGSPLVATVTNNVAPKAATAWTVAGTTVPKVDGRDFVTGKHRYTTDLTRDGMLHARVVRPPAYGATLVNADTRAAQAMPGVVVVRDGNFLAVAAPAIAAANAAVDAIKVQWSAGSRASARTLFTDLKGGAEPIRASGDAKSVSAQYTIAYIAHAPLEPRAAVAEWQGGAVTVWTGTQRPFGVQQELVDAFHVAADRVRVIVPDTGSANGGKHTGDAAVEAARIARAANKPVKLVWTREEEFWWAYFRPAGVIDVSGSVGADGLLTAWEYHNYNSGASGLSTPYAIANAVEKFHQRQSPLRQGSYRGLAATANHFARESHMDDLARAAGMDPLAFRLKNLKNERLANVLKAAADKFGWAARAKTAAGRSDVGRSDGGRSRDGVGWSEDRPLHMALVREALVGDALQGVPEERQGVPNQRQGVPSRGIGLACGVEKGGYTATCAEVEASNGTVKIRRLVVAFECGAIVNPDGLDHQVSGAVVQGLGGALFEAIEFDDGRLVNGRFSRYRVPRFADVPPIDVVLVNRPDLPSAGAGETPIVGVAPAIGNAILDATGVRIRSLPMIPTGLPNVTSQV